MSVDTATVKKVASLARIAISDADAERLAPELNNILGWIEQLGEVDTSVGRADDRRDPQHAPASGRRGHRGAAARRRPPERAAGRARLLHRAEGGRMSDVTDLGIAQLRDGVRLGNLLGARSRRRVYRQGEQGEGAQRVHRRNPRPRDRRRQGSRCRARGGRDAQAAGRRADRHEGPVRDEGRADHRGEPHPRRLQAGL